MLKPISSVASGRPRAVPYNIFSAQDRPSTSQDASRTAPRLQEPPKRHPGGSKSSPRAPQELSRSTPGVLLPGSAGLANADRIVCLRGPQVSGTHGTTPHEVRAPYLANSYLACVPFDQAVPSSFFVVHACSLVWCRPTCCLLLRVPPIAHRALGRNGCSFSLIRREGD